MDAALGTRIGVVGSAAIVVVGGGGCIVLW